MTQKRDIKFRGFHRDENGKEKVFVNGEWVKGYWLYGVPCDDYIITAVKTVEYQANDDAPTSKYVEFKYVNIIPETIGQYTGLKDKNGKEILEDSFVKDYSDGDIYKVVWQSHSATWELISKNVRRSLALLYMGTYEVIGNIYENPEMVGVG